MGVVTTRRLEDLVAEAEKAGIGHLVPEKPSREGLMDLLREHLGTFDPEMEIDPAKAKDLKHSIDWSASGLLKFAGISSYFNDSWVMEPKLDGCRMRVFLGATGNTMNTGRRSVKTYSYTSRSDNFPHIRDAVVPELAGTILDGEILAPTGKIQTHTGMWTDSLLNASVALCNSNPVGSVQTQKRFGKAVYWVFDILALNGESVMKVPYRQRRLMLEKTVELLQVKHPECQIKLVPQLPSNAETILQSIEHGFEGVMIKKLDSTYQPGKRMATWLKVKTFSTADAFVVGWAAGENGNEGLVGSLDLAVMRSDGTPRPVAQVGNLTLEMRQAISNPDGSLKQDFYGTVIEFQAQGIGKNGRARHAHMMRLRPDKTPADCQEDQIDVFPRV